MLRKNGWKFIKLCDFFFWFAHVGQVISSCDCIEAAELAIAADHFLIDSLKPICTELICSTVTVDKVWILNLLHKFGLSDIASGCHSVRFCNLACLIFDTIITFFFNTLIIYILSKFSCLVRKRKYVCMRQHSSTHPRRLSENSWNLTKSLYFKWETSDRLLLQVGAEYNW